VELGPESDAVGERGAYDERGAVCDVQGRGEWAAGWCEGCVGHDGGDGFDWGFGPVREWRVDEVRGQREELEEVEEEVW
jgi:hypothetical protein